MNLSVSEVSSLMNVSVRTLHYYDQIGLLAPSQVTDAGYRYYNDAAIDRLQQILFLRELEFSLKEIAQMLSHPEYDRLTVLSEHRELLLLKRRHIDELISLVDTTIGDNNMKNEKNNLPVGDISAAKQKYADEAKRRWGNTDAYKESERKHAAYSDTQDGDIWKLADNIFARFAQIRDTDPNSHPAQALVREWQEHITQYHYRCTDEILAGLGLMYSADERFKENLDRFGEGTARFMSDAIAAYCAK